jgi:hypothetical protein
MFIATHTERSDHPGEQLTEPAICAHRSASEGLSQGRSIATSDNPLGAR